MPKPVEVTHGNVLAYVAAVSDRLDLPAAPRIAATTTLSTDLGNTAVFPALLRAGTLEIVPADVLADPAALAPLFTAHRVEAVKLTPSYLRVLLSDPAVRLEVATLVVGGEALDWELAAEARRRGADRVVNHYGPTETSVGVFTYEVGKEQLAEAATVPLGRPLAHVRAFILDPDGRPTPYGVAGELGITGPGVALGYRGLPEETETRFVAAPSGERMYRTGDLVRLFEDGTVGFLGRIDSQVKVRGYRVELGEVETQLRRRLPVSDAAVLVDPEDPDALVAYLVTAPGAAAPTSASLTEVLSGVLPPYMIPREVRIITELPRTPSGKLDRARLVATAEPSVTMREVRAAASPTEADLLEIWRTVLERDDISTDDNFFQIGGHSLLATRIVARARSHFALDLPLHVMFASPTIESLAADIDQRRTVESLDSDLAAILEEIESMSEEEAERLLRDEADTSADEA
jgi:acyl-coenzyme A synthetase/AMP-(fatty) acid ligase